VTSRISILPLCAVAACLSLAGAPAQAEPIAELEALSRGTATPAAGIALARKQMNGSDYLGALATLERVLISHPEAEEALLLHASLLCRLDDREGAVIELDELRGRPFPDRLWNDATAPCSAGSEG
jgi:Tfp pilus assembly protein PilF